MLPLLGHAAFGFGVGTLGSFIGPLFSGVERAAKYGGNILKPNLRLDPAQAIHLYYAGKIPIQVLNDILLSSGIDATQGAESQISANTWRQFLDISKPMHSIPDYLRWYRQGRIDTNEFRNVLQRAGFNDNRNSDLAMTDYENLPIELVVRLLDREDITDIDEARAYLKSIGFRSHVIDLIIGIVNPPNPGELLVLRNRGIITHNQFYKYLGWAGIRRRDEKDLYDQLRNEIPGPSDLVRFAVRHVFEPSLAKYFGFSDEISQSFIDWHAKQGYGYDVDIVDPITGESSTINWATAHWWAHWVWPSATQAYSMFQRFRASGGPNNTPRDPSGLVFSDQDLGYLLRGNDYPPHWRPYLKALSFRLPERRVIRQMIQFNIIDEQEAIETYLDLGYHEQTAERMMNVDKFMIETTRLKSLISGQKGKVLKAYKVGSISRDVAAVQLYKLSLTSAGEIFDFGVMPAETQLSTALADLEIGSLLDNVDLDLATGLINTAIESIRKAYLRFEISQPQAQQALLQVGIASNRVATYLQAWQWQFFGRGKTLTASQLLKYVVRGAISPDTALARLVLLGYSQLDALTMIGLASEDEAVAQAKAQGKIAKNAAQAQKAAKALVSALEAQKKHAMADLSRHGTPAKLKTWLGLGLIGLDEFTLRLRKLGWPDIDINRLAIEALNKPAKGTKGAKATPPPPPQTPATSPPGP